MSTNTLDRIDSGITAAKDKVMEDLRLVVANAEELLHATANQSGAAAATARARIQESLNSVKSHLIAAEANVIQQTRHAAKVTDVYVHENPWKAIGLSACAGVVIGMLIARR